MTSRPIPKIVITASASCTEEDLKKGRNAQATDDQHGGETSDKSKNKNASRESRRKRKSSKQKSQLKTSDADAGPSGSSETKTEDSTTKKEKRKSSFLGLFDGDSSGGDRRLSLQIAARFAKLHIISQLRSLNREKKAAKTVGIIVGCLCDHDLP